MDDMVLTGQVLRVHECDDMDSYLRDTLKMRAGPRSPVFYRARRELRRYIAETGVMGEETDRQLAEVLRGLQDPTAFYHSSKMAGEIVTQETTSVVGVEEAHSSSAPKSSEKIDLSAATRNGDQAAGGALLGQYEPENLQGDESRTPVEQYAAEEVYTVDSP